MNRISLENDKIRTYYGVPKDIAEGILKRNNTLDFSGFDTYTERSTDGKVVAIFHYNEFDFYRQGLMTITR